MIHPTAIVSPKAQIGENAEIGPYSVIDEGVVIGDGVQIMSHVCITGDTRIGEGTKVFPFASLGFRPQDLKFRGEKSKLVIGKNNSIREYVTMHPGTQNGIMETRVGDGNLFMVGVHIAHDCIIGNNIVMGNNATLGGHVVIQDNVIIGGMSAVHQFVRIGQHAVIGGMSGVERDVVPFGAVKGKRASLYDLNLIGMQRMNMDRRQILTMKKLYDILFGKSGTLSDNLKRAEQSEFSQNDAARAIIDFMKQESRRSFCTPKDDK